MIGSIMTLVIALIFLILSIVLFCGKGGWLIAGYNTMDDEEKQKFDEKKLCKAAGFVCLVCCIMLCVMSYMGYKVDSGLTDENKMIPFVIVFIVVIVVSIVAAGIYMNNYAKKK